MSACTRVHPTDITCLDLMGTSESEQFLSQFNISLSVWCNFNLLPWYNHDDDADDNGDVDHTSREGPLG